jgi:hypothetical protein
LILKDLRQQPIFHAKKKRHSNMAGFSAELQCADSLRDGVQSGMWGKITNKADLHAPEMHAGPPRNLFCRIKLCSGLFIWASFFSAATSIDYYHKDCVLSLGLATMVGVGYYVGQDTRIGLMLPKH